MKSAANEWDDYEILDRRGPWQVLGSREVYRNPWICVREDQVIRPNGTRGIYGVVESPTALAIVPITADGRIYLVGQYRYTTDQYSWEVPTGSGAAGEPPLTSAQRELQEETGLAARQWTPLGPVQVSNSVTDQIGYIFLAEGLTQGQARPDETEDLVVRSVPLEEAMQDAVSGEISQAFSVVALLRAWHFLESRASTLG